MIAWMRWWDFLSGVLIISCLLESFWNFTLKAELLWIIQEPWNFLKLHLQEKVEAVKVHEDESTFVC